MARLRHDLRRQPHGEPCAAAVRRLDADTLPPIDLQKRETSARPSPVPPYLRAIDVSAWTNGRNSRAFCSWVIADAGVGDDELDRLAPSLPTARTSQRDRAARW